jgi:hypothetical protein
MDKTRELYKQKYEAQIHEWNARLDALKAQADKMTAQAKLDLKPHLDAVHAKFDAAKIRLDAISKATDEKWDDVVKDFDHGWSDLKAAAEGAYDAMKRHKKD